MDDITPAQFAEVRVLSRCDDVRTIPGYPGYVATANGQIYSYRRFVEGKPPRRMRIRNHKHQPILNLYTDAGDIVTVGLARVLLLAWGVPCPGDDYYAAFKEPGIHTAANTAWVYPGTQRGGVALPIAKAEEIRQLHRAGDVSIRQLAIDYGIGYSTAWNIVHSISHISHESETA